MKIEVATGVVGRDFAFSPGDLVEEEEFAAKIGTGWHLLVAPAAETADRRPVAERAVKPRGRRR